MVLVMHIAFELQHLFGDQLFFFLFVVQLNF